MVRGLSSCLRLEIASRKALIVATVEIKLNCLVANNAKRSKQPRLFLKPYSRSAEIELQRYKGEKRLRVLEMQVLDLRQISNKAWHVPEGYGLQKVRC